MMHAAMRSRWAAIGAAVAVTLGGGGVGLVYATNPSNASAFEPLAQPCRLAELRAPEGIGPDAERTLDGWGSVGNCNLPTGTKALAANVTALNATERTNVRLYPANAAIPETSNLNPVPGEPPAPNAVDIGLDPSSGKFTIYNFRGTVEVIVDVVGVYRDHDHDDRYGITEHWVLETTLQADPGAKELRGNIPLPADTAGFIWLTTSVGIDTTCELTGDRFGVMNIGPFPTGLQYRLYSRTAFTFGPHTADRTLTFECDNFSAGFPSHIRIEITRTLMPPLDP